MQILPTTDSSERLQDNKPDKTGNIDFRSVKNARAEEFRGEIDDVSRMYRFVEEHKNSDIVDQWARISHLAKNTNMIGRVTGLDTDLSLEETTRAYTEKSKFKDIAGFGDLKSFDIEGNDEFLEKIITDELPEADIDNSSESSPGLIDARNLVEQLARDYPISDNRFKAENDQFTLVV
jgi:hypothetical protein